MSGDPASVGLAALGELLTEVELAYERSGNDYEIGAQLQILREARDRVAKAERGSRGTAGLGEVRRVSSARGMAGR